MEISEVNPDGNVYQLKDATSRTEIAQMKAQNVYSTEEVNTGKKWIDGKPIYRRAYTGRYTAAAQGRVTLVPIAELSDVETMLDIRGIQGVSATTYSSIPNLNTSLEWHTSGSGQGVQVFTEAARTNMPITIWYEYTKTTD